MNNNLYVAMVFFVLFASSAVYALELSPFSKNWEQFLEPFLNWKLFLSYFYGISLPF
jgi:hypothetical protein